MAAYSTLHLAHVLHLFCLWDTHWATSVTAVLPPLYIFYSRRSDISPFNYSATSEWTRTNTKLVPLSIIWNHFTKKKKNSLQLCPFSRVCLAVSFLSAISSPRSLCAAGLIISDCTAGLGQMWILYSSDHRLYTFISSHSPQQCKCHVDGWGRRGRRRGALADRAWWGEGGAGGRAEVEELPESKVHREALATSPAAPEEKCKIRFALRRARTADVKTEED